MINKHLKKVVAAFTVAVITLAPAFGVLCAMPCGNGGEGAGASCCCRPSETSAATVLANPSCCASEVKSSEPGILARATVTARTLESPAAAVRVAEETAAVAGFQRPTPVFDALGNARSSPLFLLHASFII